MWLLRHNKTDDEEEEVLRQRVKATVEAELAEPPASFQSAVWESRWNRTVMKCEWRLCRRCFTSVPACGWEHD